MREIMAAEVLGNLYERSGLTDPGVPRIKVGVEWDGPARDVRSWEQMLEQVAPRQERATWLKPVWVAGDLFEADRRDDIVERWVIYQMYPLSLLEEMLDPAMFDLILSDLHGPNPRNRTRYDYVMHQAHPDPRCNIDRIQWLLFKETGCFGRPLWVVQGDKGGHKRRWSHNEKAVSTMLGGPEEPPLPGDLPYAEPDWRTLAALAQINTLRQACDILAEVKRDPKLFSDEELAEMEPLRRYAHAWLESEIDEATGDFGSAGSTYTVR